MNKSRNFPWLILIIGISFLCLTSWSIYRASKGTSAVTDREYYSHGLRYNETLLERKAAESLGWTVKSAIQDQTLSFLLTDREGKPVTEANGTLELFIKKKASTIRLPLFHTGSGNYQVTIPEVISGEMNARLEFEQNGVRLSKQLLLNF